MGNSDITLASDKADSGSATVKVNGVSVTPTYQDHRSVLRNVTDD